MNIAIIFAGGVGTRMHSGGIPKQFLEYLGKPILVYTLDHFQKSDKVDKIILISIESYIDKCWSFVKKFDLTKVVAIVPGGSNGFLSIDNGLRKAAELYPSDSCVLIHDGVRPLINLGIISDCVDSVKRHGNAITVSSATETIIVQNSDNRVVDILDRSVCQIAKAPQCFLLKDILEKHDLALKEGLTDFIDSACLMNYYGVELYTVLGPNDNIKITTPTDFFAFKAFVEARKNSEIFGL